MYVQVGARHAAEAGKQETAEHVRRRGQGQPLSSVAKTQVEHARELPDEADREALRTHVRPCLFGTYSPLT